MFKPRGIAVPIVTPFYADGSINFDVYRELINHLIKNGVHGIFPLGTTGEFYALSDEDACELLRVTVGTVEGRVPVYAGANHITTAGVTRFIRLCEGIKGIDALSVLTPMFVSQTQEELYRHYRVIADSTDLPIVMYNNKPKTNVAIEPKTAASLAEVPNIVGVKDSTGDFTNTLEYIRLTRDAENFSVMLGKDTLIFAGLCSGASGAIASCANIAPRLVSSIYDLFMAGNCEEAREAQFRLNPIRLACNMSTFPSAIKAGLVLRGFDAGKCLPPIGELTPEQTAALGEALEGIE
jgi:4-hydroxy-tetrahydrodipicolinate synthase